MSDAYHAQSSLAGLDQMSHSQIEASRARGLMEEHHSQIGKGDDEDRFGKGAVGQNQSNLTARGIDTLYMREALKEAKKAFDLEEVPVGAVLVHGGSIIARGHNQIELLQDATAHAEMLCLTSGAAALENWRLTGATLYCTLEPCCMCAGAMISSRIDRLVFGAPDLRVGVCGSWIDLFKTEHPIHSIEIVRGVLEAESAALMREFFQQTRKKKCMTKSYSS